MYSGCNNSDLLKDIRKTIKEGDFTLTSGMKSNFYVDIKSLLLKPDFLMPIGKMIINEIDICDEEIFAVGGMELSSVPISTATCIASEHIIYSNIYSLEQFIIRKTKKTHGTCNKVEGWDNIKNKNIVLVDDVLTTGKSIRNMYNTVKDHANVVMIIVIVDREDICDGRLNLEKELKTPVVALFNKKELM
jgi:orotate phosphoribosyltransferase